MTENNKKTISRRAVAGGMAWTVPAIAFASAAPAATVSPLYTVSTDNVCKYPGEKVKGVKHAYMFPLTLTNVATEEVCVQIVSGIVTFDSGRKDGDPEWYSKPPHKGGVLAPDTVCIPVGESETYFYVVDDTGNSANESGTAVGTFLGTGAETGRKDEKTVRVAFDSTPPKCETVLPGSGSTESDAPAAQESTPVTPEAVPGAESSQAAAPATTETAAPASAAETTAPASPTASPEVAATETQRQQP
ncbi:hypothetical protein [Micrococcus terreus]|uniref:Uncharacterized protein n=1 Tax=Micrococcus terreus TaxID=574650 RepID=A0A1I7MP76_9MICC|nr:hypothetical protein [Micrococcus terreus]SFV23735.1 hypothetical protein SAMN04487966_10864 [Micrococcus terreus]